MKYTERVAAVWLEVVFEEEGAKKGMGEGKRRLERGMGRWSGEKEDGEGNKRMKR